LLARWPSRPRKRNNCPPPAQSNRRRQWTAAGAGPRLCVLIHHTDAERESAYDRESHVGKLDKALDEASSRGWTVVDMSKDWNSVFGFETP
jgi:hypothetical protein